MKQGKSRFSLLLSAALTGLFALGSVGTASPAFAQKPAPAAHAKPKPKHKKPKPPGKSPHHAGGAAPSSGGKAHAGATGKAPPAGAFVVAQARAQAPAAAPRDPVEIRLPVQRVTLDNGLRVVMSVDRTSAAVAVSVAYDVGARDEPKGRSGFARLVERMMFEGSANVLKGDHARLVASHGGEPKSHAGTDMTVFTEALPANELALGLWLEADRMRSLDLSAEALESQRKAAQEEARGSLGSGPGASQARLNELVFQGFWPNEHPAAGSPDDLDAAKIEAVKEFHASHYGPNNAALVIAGNFDPDEAMSLVHKHFDAIPRISVTPLGEGELPEQTAQRTAVMHRDDVKTPEIRYGWAIPPSRSADREAVELAALVIAEGESSRLYQMLVREKALAEDVSATVSPMSRGPGSLTIVARLADGAKTGDVEKLIEAELKRLGAAAPSEAEMQKARRRAQARFVLGSLSTITSRADRLAAYEVMFGSALHINEELPRITAASAEDVRRVTAQYLGPTRRTLVETYPVGFDPTATAPHKTYPASFDPTAQAPHKKTAGKGGAAKANKKSAAKSGAAKASSNAKKKTAASAKTKKPKKP